MPSRPETRAATALLHATGTAAASVIAARLQAFSDPATLLSPWHQSEARRMTSEKLDAASQGMQAAGIELALLPARMLMIGARPAAWCFGTAPTLADCVLVPQIYNAQRFDTPLNGLPRTMAAFDACMALPAFQGAQPSACPDAEG